MNSDLGAERWTISAGLATDDVESITSVTGNVFQRDGAPPSFVLCQIRSDSTGTLQDPSSAFRLSCRGTGACESSARVCARDDWRPIADLVELPASFFLPPGGLGTSDQVATTGANSWIARAAARLLLAGASTEGGEPSDRGATLSLDRLNYLVNKDVGGERWSISLNLAPIQTPSGGTLNQVVSVTGNIYFPDGRVPGFVYCSIREDSTGTLEDAASEFRLRCSGSGACADSAEVCAATSWTPIADDIHLSAGFFLPPAGLPPSVTTDPEILVIGRTSDPPSIVTKQFRSGDTPNGWFGIAAGETCSVGRQCFASRVGRCTDVQGSLVEIPNFGCGCEIEEVPPTCIVCGAGATGSCGSTGEYPVGDSTARGVCLPFSAQNGDCIVYAVDSRGTEDSVVESCGGVLESTCPGTKCCADDPRDGCRAGSRCPGICVSTASCDPSSGQCEACFDSRPPAGTCGNGVRELGEECDGADLHGETCATLGFGPGTLACNGQCEFETTTCGGAPVCGNNVRDPGEQCDGTDLGNATCSTVTNGSRPNGTISCSGSCAIDDSACTGQVPSDCFLLTDCRCEEDGPVAGLCILGAAVSFTCSNPVAVSMAMTSNCQLSANFVLTPGDTEAVSTRCDGASESFTYEAEAVDTVSGASVYLSGQCGLGQEQGFLP